MSNEVDFSVEMQDLANIIAQYAPENWEKMSVIFEEYAPGDYGIDSWAIIASENIPVDFDEDDIDNLETIFSIIQKKSIEKWKSAQFEFTSDGDCEISFAY